MTDLDRLACGGGSLKDSPEITFSQRVLSLSTVPNGNIMSLYLPQVAGGSGAQLW